MSRKLTSLLAVLASFATGTSVASAAGTTPGAMGIAPLEGPGPQRFSAPLDPIQEVPAISSAARGRVVLEMIPGSEELRYELSYEALEGEVAQAHLHFGQPGVNGGVLAWLCGTAASPGPQGTPACPAPSGTVAGTLAAAQVIGPSNQGVGAGAWDALVEALRAGLVYANVHSDRFPGGEARGQLRPGRSPVR